MHNTKKRAACVALVLLLALSLPLTSLADETRIVTCGTLNLRAAATTASAVIGQYGWGTRVTVKGYVGDWAIVEVGGQTGYMYARYLGVEGTTNTVRYVATNGRGLNLRAAPGGQILTSFPRGTAVTVLSTFGGWSYVSVGGMTGYMDSQWLSATMPWGAPSTAPSAPSGSATPAEPSGSGVTRYVATNARGLNLRSAPGGAIITSFPRGTAVTVFSTVGGWSYVSVGGLYGYMASQWLTSAAPAGPAAPSSPSATPAEPGSGVTRYVATNARGLNLRSAPGGAIITSFPRGTAVTVFSTVGGWSYVSVGGLYGYMASQWLTSAAPAGPAVPSATPAEPGSFVIRYVATNARGLNLRATPGGAIITSFPRGTAVNVFSTVGGWSYVSVGGLYGYMASQWLSAAWLPGQAATPSEPSATPSEPFIPSPSLSPLGTAVVNNPRSTQVLFLRSAPSTTSQALGYYRNGKAVTLIQNLGDWYKVSVDGRIGYMMAKYLKVTRGIGASSAPGNGGATVYNPNGGSYVNLRASDSLNSAVLRRVPVGTWITVLSKTTDWTKTTFDGVTGYISSWFLKY